MASGDPIELTDAAKRAFSVQDYSPAPVIQGVQLVELKRITDDGGSFMELARLQQGMVAARPGFACGDFRFLQQTNERRLHFDRICGIRQDATRKDDGGG